MIESEVNNQRHGGRARLEGRRCGLVARKHHAAGFMLAEPYTDRVVHGDGYTLSARQRRTLGAQAQSLEPHPIIADIRPR
jgi:hypothetical protein